MPETTAVLEAITEAIASINETLPSQKQVSLEPDAVLYGPGGVIDSLTLTLLMVSLEQKIEQKLHVSISLIDQTIVSQDNAFGSIRQLKKHIELLVNR